MSEGGELGPARATTIRYTGLQGAPDLLVKIRTYVDRAFGDPQITAQNSSSTSLQIQSFRLLEAEGESVIHLGRDATANRVLSDSFSEDRRAMQIRDLTNIENHVHRAVGVQLLYNRQSGQSWFIGALTSNKFLSVLRLHMRQVGGREVMGSYEVDSTGTTELLSEHSLLDSPASDRVELSQILPPKGELSSERMLFGVSSDYHDQLITYAHLVRDLHHARVTAPTPMGWWSWTAFYFGLNEGIAQANADWLSQHLKPLGYTNFHMDEGYQFARGEYATPDDSLLPNGVEALEHKVLNAGLTPGIWTAPFQVSERSWIYSHHPEWLVHNERGEPIHTSSAKIGEAVSFSASSSDEDNPALRYDWGFGDGVSLEGAKLRHTYTHDGVFTAYLKVTGFAGEVSSKIFTIAVTGTLNTKYAPQDKRRFVERRP